MTSLQKVIKYGAILFGFYLVFVILSAIIFGITTVFGISVGLDAYKNYSSSQEVGIIEFNDNFENARSLDIKLDISKLSIKNGNEFKVQVNNPTNDFYCKMDGDTLKIKDKSSGFNLFGFSNDFIPEIVMYIPENYKFDEIEIEAGVNESYIQKLLADEISIETGVGKFTIDDIKSYVLNIHGGAGETAIKKSIVDEMKLEAGVGKFVINSDIVKEAKVEAGVGQLIVNLQGLKSKYKVKTSTGIGALFVDNKKVADNQTVGDGDTFVKVEAGVGEVRVNFTDNN